MTDRLTAPALAQALEKLAKRLVDIDCPLDHAEEPCDWCAWTRDFLALSSAAAALRAAVRPERVQLRNRDTPENAAFWDSIDAAVATWERTKPTWQRELDRAAVRGAETPTPVDKFPDFDPTATPEAQAKWLDDFARFAGIVRAAAVPPAPAPLEHTTSPINTTGQDVIVLTQPDGSLRAWKASDYPDGPSHVAEAAPLPPQGEQKKP